MPIRPSGKKLELIKEKKIRNFCSKQSGIRSDLFDSKLTKKNDP